MVMRFGPFEVLDNPDAPGEPHMLGRGGMGTTYKARDTRISRIVALKTVRLDQLSDSPETSIKRFEAEARMLAGLNHPNIAVFLESGQQAGNWYYAMEFIQGRDLEHEVKQKGPLPLPDALDVAMQAAQALTELDKKKLVHRDIKPGNLMAIPLEGGRRAIKLIDFGISKTFGGSNESSLTLESTSGLIPFSADTCSPEQAEGKTDLDVRSDIFSLGATLWYLVTGRYPFHAGDSSIRRIASRIYEEAPYKELAGHHPALTDLLRKMMARNRQFRPATAAELVRDIQGVLSEVSGATSASIPVLPSPRPPPPPGPDTTNATAVAPPVVHRSPGRGRGFVAFVLTVLVTLATWDAFFRHPTSVGDAQGATESTPPATGALPSGVPVVAPLDPVTPGPPTPEAPKVVADPEKMAPPVIPVPPPPVLPPPVDLAKRARAEAMVRDVHVHVARIAALGTLPPEDLARREVLAATSEQLAKRLAEGTLDALLEEGTAAIAEGEALWTAHLARGAKALADWNPTFERLPAAQASPLAPLAFQRADEALAVARERIVASHYSVMDVELASVQGAFRAAESQALRVSETREQIGRWLESLANQPAASTELVAESWKDLRQTAADLSADETNLDATQASLAALEKRRGELLALNGELLRKREEQAALAMKRQADEAALRRRQTEALDAARQRILPQLRQSVVLGGDASALAAEAKGVLANLAGSNAPGTKETITQIEALLPRLGQAPKALDAASLDLGNGLLLELVYVPAGSFLMGSRPEDQKRLMSTVTPAQRKYWETKLKLPDYLASLKILLGFEAQRKVSLTQGFWIGRTEVTQGAWTRLMGSNPSLFKSAGPTAPVENVSWDDTQLFLAALNTRLGRPAARLPTEAEWEYACRAGTETDIPAGNLEILGANHSPTLDPYAWYGGNSRVDLAEASFDSGVEPEKQYPGNRSGTHAVGLKKANPWGLFDMIGGVSEWCQDWLDPSWSNPEKDPKGPPTGSFRVVRGGSWADQAIYCRASNRSAVNPRSRSFSFGFRVVIVP